jgi:hypothetical protein
VAQVPLAEDDDKIKTFPPERANQPFRMSILPWRAWRGWPVTNAHGAKPPGKTFAIDPVAIAVATALHKEDFLGAASTMRWMRSSSDYDR